MDVGQSIAMYFAVAMAGPFLLHLFLKSIRQWRYRKILAEPEPRCRACGYIIVPGSSAICPECGGELRKVGAIAPSILPPPIPFPLMFLAFMICLPPACLMGFWMASHFPIGGGYQTIARWQETETMIGGRRLDVRFQMTAKGRSFFGRKRPDEVQIEWFRQSLEAHEWENVTYSDRVLEPTLPPDLNEATRFISLARFDRTSETGKAIAARVAMALAAYRHGRFQISLADAQVSTKYYPTDFAQGATITVVLLLLMALPLALVVRAHVRRCRRLAAEADALLDRLGIPATSQTQPDAAALPGGR